MSLCKKKKAELALHSAQGLSVERAETVMKIIRVGEVFSNQMSCL